MTSPMTPSSRTPGAASAAPSDTASDPAADRRLQQALRDLAIPEPQRLEALQARVLAGWQAGHRETAVVPQPLVQGPRLVLAGGGRRRWLLGSGVVLGGLALGLGLWLRQPDPALEELLQPDVLSQMAIGEM